MKARLCQRSQVVKRVANVRVYDRQEVWRGGGAIPVVIAKVKVGTFDGQVSQMSDDGPFGAGQLELLTIPQLGQEFCIGLCQLRLRNFESHLTETLRGNRHVFFVVFVVRRKRGVHAGRNARIEFRRGISIERCLDGCPESGGRSSSAPCRTRASLESVCLAQWCGGTFRGGAPEIELRSLL